MNRDLKDVCSKQNHKNDVKNPQNIQDLQEKVSSDTTIIEKLKELQEENKNLREQLD